MKDRFRFQLASLAIELAFANRRFCADIAQRYKDCLSKTKPQITFNCFRAKVPMGSPNTLAKVTHENYWRAQRFDFAAQWIRSKGDARLSQWRMASFDSFLRVFYATALPGRHGLLMHASGIEAGGKAFLFVGPSGYGKTTICELSGPRRILSDEIIALSTTHRKNFAWATPFWGSLGTGPCPQKKYPLKEILFLKKDKEHRKTSVDPSIAFARLLRCVCRFDHCDAQTEIILGLLDRLVSNTSCSELHFRKDADFWNLLES